MTRDSRELAERLALDAIAKNDKISMDLGLKWSESPSAYDRGVYANAQQFIERETSKLTKLIGELK